MRDQVPPGWRTARAFLVALIVMNVIGSIWVGYENGRMGSPPFAYGNIDPLHRVRAVEPGSEAARAGVRVGDRIDVDAMPPDDRHRVSVGWTGRAIDYRMIDAGGRRYDVVLHRRDTPNRNTFYDVVYPLIGAIAMILAAIVLWRRPGLMTVAFAYYTCGALTFATKTAFVVSSGLPDGLFTAVSSAIIVLLGPLPVVALLPFLARFPSGTAHGPRRFIIRAADTAFVGAAILMYAFMVRGYPGTTRPAEAAAGSLFTGVALLVGSIVLYARSDGDERRRVAWVLIGLLISAFGYGFIGTPYNGPEHPVTWILILFSFTAFPITVFYVIVRHRLIDPGFALNRALVYGVVTAFVVAGVSLIDFAVGRLISESKVALALEAVAAVLIGFGLNWLHAGTEHLVERTLFRNRHRVELQIEARIAALDYAGEVDSIDVALVLDVARLMKLGSAALFVRDDVVGHFVRREAVDWDGDTAVTMPAESLLVRTLRASERTAELDVLDDTERRFPEGSRAPDLAIPMIAGHELRGIALYGKRNGTGALDPEERRLLERLAKAAAIADERIEAAAWRRRAEAAESKDGHGAQSQTLDPPT